MKVGILYICTGKYSAFWDIFYKSSEEYFLPDHEKHYYVFTDDAKIIETNNIHVKYESPNGFPLDSLLRFKMFLSIEDKLRDMDFIYFFNSNMKFVKFVNEEILPLNVESGLVAVKHPGYFDKNSELFPYERNKKSTAYISYNSDERYNYFMGSLNGGSTDQYLELIRECSKSIDTDTQNGIMAIYHDESHLNRYLHNKIILGLTPSFAFPEDSAIPFDPKIIILNKMKHAGAYFDKLPRKSYYLRVKLKIKRMYATLIWKFQ